MQYVWYVRRICPSHVQLTRLAWYSQFLFAWKPETKIGVEDMLNHSRGLGGNSLIEHDYYDPKGSKITCDHLTKPTGWHLVHYHSSILECYPSTTFHQSLSTFHVIHVGLQRAGTHVAYHVYSPISHQLQTGYCCLAFAKRNQSSWTFRVSAWEKWNHPLHKHLQTPTLLPLSIPNLKTRLHRGQASCGTYDSCEDWNTSLVASMIQASAVWSLLNCKNVPWVHAKCWFPLPNTTGCSAKLFPGPPTEAPLRWKASTSMKGLRAVKRWQRLLARPWSYGWRVKDEERFKKKCMLI